MHPIKSPVGENILVGRPMRNSVRKSMHLIGIPTPVDLLIERLLGSPKRDDKPFVGRAMSSAMESSLYGIGSGKSSGHHGTSHGKSPGIPSGTYHVIPWGVSCSWYSVCFRGKLRAKSQEK